MEISIFSSPTVRENGKGNKPLVYTCKTCGKGFAQNYMLRKHLDIHLGVKPHECTVCGKCYFRRDRLNRHMLTHNEEKPYSCEICNKGFVSHPELLIHLRVHPGETFHCSKCDEAFTDVKLLKAHYKQHLDDRLYSCTECDRSFKSVGHLRQHASIHAPDNQQYKCTQCPRTFTLKSGFDAHVLMHELQYKRRQWCEVCGMKFNRRSDLSDHMLIHRNEGGEGEGGGMLCGKCGVGFKTSELLSLHCKSTHMKAGGGQTSHVCTLCDQTYENMFTYEQHVTTSHPQHEAFVCVECDEKFQRATELLDHMFSSHDEAPRCAACATRFVDVQSLREHVVGEGFHVCDVCGRAFESNKLFHSHKLTHNVMRCEECNITFTRRKQYQKHLTSNHNSALYTCSQCDCVFNCAYSRRTHIVRMHADPSNSCTECAQYSLDSTSTMTSDISSDSPLDFSLSRGTKRNGTSKSRVKSDKSLKRSTNQIFQSAQYECSICSKSFKDSESLSIHALLGSCSGSQVPHVCMECDMKFSSASALHYHSAMHMSDSELVDQDEPDYVCCECDSSFYNSFQLRGHLLIHEEERETICPVCDESLGSKQEYAEHVVRHTILRPYPCDCGQSFVDRRLLRRHHRTCRLHMLCVEAEEIAIRISSNKQNGAGSAAINGKSAARMLSERCNEKSTRGEEGEEGGRGVGGVCICGVCMTVFDEFILLKQHMKKHV